MINFTMDDVKKLADLYEANAEPNPMTPEEIAQYGGGFNYPDLMDSIIEERVTVEATVLEFIGAYENAASCSEDYNVIREFIFEQPLNNLPKYINKSEDEPWKSMIASWRLSLGK